MRFIRDVLLVLRGRDDLGDKFIVNSDGTEQAREDAALQSGAFLTVQELERERRQMVRHSF